MFIKIKHFLENEKLALKWATSLLLIGSILFGINLYESKIGLDNSNAIISETCDKINGIGKETKLVLYNYRYIDNLYYLKDSSKIDESRFNLIKSHFKVGKNMLRNETFILSIIFMVITIEASALIYMWIILKQVVDSYILKKKFTDIIDKLK